MEICFQNFQISHDLTKHIYGDQSTHAPAPGATLVILWCFTIAASHCEGPKCQSSKSLSALFFAIVLSLMQFNLMACNVVFHGQKQGMQEQTTCQHVKMLTHVWTLVGHFPIPCLDLRPNMDLNVRRVFQKCKTVNTYIDGNLTGSSSTEIATIMLRWKIEEQRRQELIQKSKPRPSQPSPSQKVYDMLCEMDLKEKAQKTEQPVEQQLGPISNFSFEWDSDGGEGSAAVHA